MSGQVVATESGYSTMLICRGEVILQFSIFLPSNSRNYYPCYLFLGKVNSLINYSSPYVYLYEWTFQNKRSLK